MAAKTKDPETRAAALGAKLAKRYPALSVRAYMQGDQIALDASSELGSFVEYADPSASDDEIMQEVSSYYMDLQYDTEQHRARQQPVRG